ncbi:MAG: 4-hydroxythreonine-4-phosphate dehydrogenase PdxA [Desulfurobacteriaceae bacterium]
MPFLETLNASFFIYGSSKVIDFYSKLLRIPIKIEKVDSPDRTKRGIYLIDVVENPDFNVGKISKSSGIVQYEFLKRSVKDAKKGLIDAITTLPINKEAIRLAGFKFPGHTEYLASCFNVKEFAMMLANEKLKVVLLTTHVSLKEVPELITKEKIISKLRLIHKTLNSPKIAVASLNPHGGENGLFGKEEIEIINPAIAETRKEGINVYPFALPSDTVFVRALKGEFDVVLCMYHDQGLIPIKLLDFGNSVNVTLGLPIVRTSVDHGTAYDIAGKGLANPESFKLAIKMAMEMVEKRSFRKS